MATSKNPLAGKLNFQPETPPGGMGGLKTYENLRQRQNQRQAGIYPYRTVAYSQAQLPNDYAIGIDTTLQNVTLTLMLASTSPPYQIAVKWVAGTNTATIQCQSGGDELDGSTSYTFVSLNDCVILLSVGNNKILILSKF